MNKSLLLMIMKSAANSYDDWQAWCNLGGVNPSTYGSLAAVVASSTAMTTLAASTAAVDYMILSQSVIMPAVVGSVNAMTKIASNAYATTLFIANSVWVSAILASANAITGLDASTPTVIPTMTGYSTPSGTAAADTEYGGYLSWYAFKKVLADPWISALTSSVHYVQYRFPTAVWPYKFALQPYDATNGGAKNIKLQGSNDGTNFTDLTSTFTAVKNSLLQSFTCDLANTTKYQYIRVRFADSYAADGRIGVSNVQFYGK